MTDAPDRIWARKRDRRTISGTSTTTELEQSWCEKYLNPEIASACNATQYLKATPAREHADELEEAVRILAQELSWLSFGECRGFHDGAIIGSNEAISKARAILAKIK